MELGTFGAIMGYAIDLEQRLVEFFEAAMQNAQEQPFATLAGKARKRLRRLEVARREGVNEMILEPIDGLTSDAYEERLAAGVAHAAPFDATRILLEVAAQFYGEAAAKMPVREVSRLLDRLARECESQRAELSAISE